MLSNTGMSERSTSFASLPRADLASAPLVSPSKKPLVAQEREQGTTRSKRASSRFERTTCKNSSFVCTSFSCAPLTRFVASTPSVVAAEFPPRDKSYHPIYLHLILGSISFGASCLSLSPVSSSDASRPLSPSMLQTSLSFSFAQPRKQKTAMRITNFET